MLKEKFIEYIESIGFSTFRNADDFYYYENYSIDLYRTYYNFHDGSKWTNDILYNDLTPIIKKLRSNKIKKILE